MASRNNFEKIDFQPYVDTVKNGIIPWNIFVKTMEDLSYSDIKRLKYLNAVLLNELTISYSDLEKLKYINILLLTQFKDCIERENYHNPVFEESNLNDETILKETSNGGDIHTLISGENEVKKENLDSIIIEETPECDQSIATAKHFFCHICNKNYDLYFHLKQHIRKVHEKNVTLDYDKQLIKTKSHDVEAQINTIQEKRQKFHKSEKPQLSTNSNEKKLYSLHHQKNAVDKCGKSLKSHEGHKDNKCDDGQNDPTKMIADQRKIVRNYCCDKCEKSFVSQSKLSSHFDGFHEVKGDHKSVNCGKSFSDKGNLKKHIHTVHEGHKDFKCESCGKIFSSFDETHSYNS